MSLRTFPAAKTKEGLRPPVPPSQRRSPPVAVLRYVFVILPMRTAWAVRKMPWWQKILLFGVVLGGLGATGYFFLQYKKAEKDKREIAAEWANFELAAGKLDQEQMKAILGRLEQKLPDEPLVKKRQESINRGEADDNDQVMILYWMWKYRNANHLENAAKEARKRIKTNPEDWLARCILADSALKQGKKDEANAHLDAMASPLAPGQPTISPFCLEYAMNLHSALNREDGALRMYRATRLAHVIKDPNVTTLEAGVQLALLNCYIKALDEDIGTYGELPGYWVGSNRLAQFLLEDQNSDFNRLVILGGLQAKQLEILDRFVVKKIMTAEKAQPFKDELIDRIEEIWKKVREMNPKSPDGYFGAAILDHYRHRIDSALKYLERAREVSGNDANYVQAEARFRRQFDKPGADLAMLKEVSQQNPENGSIHFLMAQSALENGHLEEALEAARQAHKVDPKQTWPAILEAKVHLDREEYKEAFDVLKDFKAVLGKDPVSSELYVRALCQTKASKELRPFLEKMLDGAESSQVPLVVTPSLWAAQRAGFSDDVAVVSDKAAKKFEKYDKNLLLVVGDSNAAAAEPKTEGGSWNRAMLSIALRAYERVQEVEPDNLEVANSQAWLYLKGVGAVEAAEQRAKPLFDAYREGRPLPHYMLATLGAIDLARSRFDDARNKLTRSIEAPSSPTYTWSSSLSRGSPSAEKCVLLASAYIRLQQYEKARQNLDLAASLPRSPRVSSELNLVQKDLDGKNP